MFHVKRFLFIIIFSPLIGYTQHFGSTTLEVKTMPTLPAKIDSIQAFLNTSPLYNSLTPDVREWFYWTNYSRTNPKAFWDSIIQPILTTYPAIVSGNTKSLEQDLKNSISLPLLRPSIKLLNTSQLLANELAEKNAPPSHTSPSGSTFPERMKASQIRTCAGENISFGPQNPVLMLVLLYIDEGVPGLGHRRSLLNPAFREMGVGISQYTNHNTVVIQEFACTQM